MAFALPLLMFNTDLQSVKGPAVWCLISMALGAVAFVTAAVVMHAAFLDAGSGIQTHTIAALIVAVCIGGTPNMAAVRVALNVPSPLFVAVHTTEVVVGALYVLAMMTVWRCSLRPCFREYDGGLAPCQCLRGKPATLPSKDDPSTADDKVTAAMPGHVELAPMPGTSTPSEGSDEEAPDAKEQVPQDGPGDTVAGGKPSQTRHASTGSTEALTEQEAEDEATLHRMSAGVEAYAAMCRREDRCGIAKALLLTLVVVGFGAGLGLLAGQWSTLVTILLLSAASLLLSLVPAVRALPHTFTLGEGIVLVFCVAVGMMADLETLANTDPGVALLVVCIMVVGVALHHLLAGVARIDGDTFIVSSAANLLSPPFVGVACKAVDNRQLIAPGVTAGLVGYALANFIGVALGTILAPAA